MGTREVARMVGLTEAQVRAFVRDGFLTPERDETGAPRFTFQDLVLLRAARGLVEARIPAARVRRAMARLREQLPEGRPLSGVHIAADGDRIVVTDGGTRWHPESGQALLDFSVDEIAAPVAPLPQRDSAPEPVAPVDAETWYERACDLEAARPDEAREAYRRAIALDPSHVEAMVNLGRLLHEAGDGEAAVATWRRALAVRPGDAIAAFNLGVALEDLGRRGEAIAAYEQAVAADPACADAHYNLAHLLERTDPAAALRHLAEYRKLTRR